MIAMIRIKIRKIGKGTEEDPYRPAFIDSQGREYGRDVKGISYAVIKQEGDYFIVEIDEKDLERLKKDGVKFEVV